jgi:hypothetical protein
MGDFPDITSPLGWDFREQDSGMMNLFRSKIRNQHSTFINPSHPGDGAGYWTSIDECRLLILDF